MLPPLAVAEPPLYVTRSKPDRSFSMIARIMRDVPPLRHHRHGQWPMILWETGPFEPQTQQFYEQLLARGLTQHIHMDAAMIPTAKALQKAGSPIIMMESQSGNFPFRLAGQKRDWAHQFEPGFTPLGQVRACPAITRGWAIEADRIRATLRRFKEAGVTVNAVWMDWEVEPAPGADDYDQAIHCLRCRATLPVGVLASQSAFYQYCIRKYVELAGTYIAAPVGEIFPGCSTTNWAAVVSSPIHPVMAGSQNPMVPRIPPIFTATNPVAYGMTFYFDYWERSFSLDQEHVDQFYTHFLLRQTSADAANRQIFAPHMQSVPWVARWCNDEDPDWEKRPIMTRERYREVLRHLWLRGIRDMQVFNALQRGFGEMAVYEVQDAVAVYDEMLEVADVLDGGEVLNLAIPRIQDDDVIWSGVRKGSDAVIRTFKPGGGAADVSVAPWPETHVVLTASARGETYRLHKGEGKVDVHAVGAE